ncbi:hypothetical protein LCGC14_2068970 [marine sediment metagenome]|uniref:AP2/ERF domain-containing protein n=1 Tax=marine sediment metagenome TaxID=412755 RepID=A0A0F9EJ41_9ZZZZ
MGQLIDETENQYGRLKVIRRAGIKGSRATWLCQCVCGGKSIVIGKNLRNGNTTSCGCRLREIRDHIGEVNLSHGRSGTKEHQAWLAAKNRCFNPNYRSHEFYRDKGMYEGWIQDFEAFYEHVGPSPSPKHSIDRIDNERGYEPGNVRWATAKQQRNNQRSKYCVPRAVYEAMTEPIVFVYTSV